MQFGEDHKTGLRVRLVVLCFIGLILGFAVWFAASLKPALAEKKLFTISAGEGFRDVAEKLEDGGFIRSALAAKIYFVVSGSAFHLQQGIYFFNPKDGVPEISAILNSGEKQAERVTIPEGSSIYDIDKILADNFVIKKGEFISFVKNADRVIGGSTGSLNIKEGYLFPDTYDFFLMSSPKDIAEKMRANFEAKAAPVLAGAPKLAERNLILASILEKEVPSEYDRRVVSGVLLRRIAIGMPLQVDATICYIKEQAGAESCYPFSPDDFKAKNPYNTYLNRGLPPGPIGNPGLSSIRAAMAPIASKYLYYLSDPATGKTIFSETLDTHASNRVKYLKK